MIVRTFLSCSSLAVIALKQILERFALHDSIAALVSSREATAGASAPLKKRSARPYSERTGPGLGDAFAAWGGPDGVRPPINGSERKLIELRTINTITNRTTAPPPYRKPCF